MLALTPGCIVVLKPERTALGLMLAKPGDRIRITNIYADTNLPNGSGRFTLPTWDGYVDHPNPNKRHIMAGRHEDILCWEPPKNTR